jgi:hypothetical protein
MYTGRYERQQANINNIQTALDERRRPDNVDLG